MRFNPLLLALALTACADGVPTERWRQGSAPIVGGIEDEGHGYVIGVGDNTTAWCSATLISQQTVLTAAHCVTDGFVVTRVYIGKNLSTSFPVDLVVPHPDFDLTLTEPDLAVVRLTAPLVMQSAPLLRQTLTDSAPFVGRPWTFVGFGMNDPANMAGFGTRRVATFPIAHVGPTTLPDLTPLTANYFYYDVNSAATCFGDSGGPAFYIDQGVEHVGGVASFTSDDLCSMYGAHARSDQLAITAWIQQTIDLLEPGAPCKNDGVCNEACNTGGQVFDADCQAAHCGADSMCALACVAPVDPDCTAVSHCGLDGVCDPSCNPADPDCGGTTTTTTSTTSVTSSTTSSTTTASTTTTSSTTTGGAQSGGGGAPEADDSLLLYGRACSYGAPGEARTDWRWLLLGVALWKRRRAVIESR